MTTKAKRCTCGGYPKIEEETHFYGGGRHKGAERSESWEAHCKGKNCCRRVSRRHGVFETEEEVVEAWNERVTRAEERRDAPDKMIYDLEQSDDIVRQALARLLKACHD